MRSPDQSLAVPSSMKSAITDLAKQISQLSVAQAHSGVQQASQYLRPILFNETNFSYDVMTQWVIAGSDNDTRFILCGSESMLYYTRQIIKSLQ